MAVSHRVDDDNAKKFALPGERYHSITQSGDNLYKITQHYGYRPYVVPGPKAEAVYSEVKLSSSISRTKRTILELSLANEWDYFIVAFLRSKILSVSTTNVSFRRTVNRFRFRYIGSLLSILHPGHLRPCHYLGTERSRPDYGEFAIQRKEIFAGAFLSDTSIL